MKGTLSTQSYRPTPQHELLLRAALLEGDEAIRAWEEWRDATDINVVDYSSYRILPLLSENMRAHGVNDPLTGLLKGVHRRLWYKNQLLFGRVADFLRVMHDAGIRTMLLKGTAVSALYYSDGGLREMGDADVLVPTAQAAEALRTAFAREWQPISYGVDVPASFFYARHSLDLTHAGRYNVDLHWHVLHECCEAGADEDFWKDAVPLEFNGAQTHALNPADQLLHTCVHGMAWSPSPELRWIADAAMILKRTPHLDWQRLVAQTQTRRLTLAVRDALTYLRGLLDAPVPAETLRQLHALPVTRAERLDYRRKTSSVNTLGLAAFLRTYAQLYARSTSHVSWWAGPKEFAKFLRFTWGGESLARLPLQAILKVVRRAQVSAGKRGPSTSISANQ